MIQIILNPEQEKLLQEQLKTGKYKNPDEVITDALKSLAEKRQINQPQQSVTILSGESAQNLLEEKIKMMQEIKNNYRPDPHRQTLAIEFIELCEETQALHANQPLTEAEIAEEIDAYRRGE
jgi:antitoxin ParD1/3/4